MITGDAQQAQGPRPTAVTGAIVAKSAASDFARFFYPWSAFKVEIRVGAVSYPCVKRDKTGNYILIPREMADDYVDTPGRLLFHLLMIGHEIAHLVHRHLDGASDQSDDDYRSLELWADFYGAKVAMTLLTYGEQLFPIAARFWPDRDLHGLLSNIGGAVGALVTKVYRDHKRYPSKLERAGLISNGVLSFVRNYYGTAFDLRLYYSVPVRVLADPAVRELMLMDGGRTDFSDEPVMRAARWHRRVQGTATSITPGFLPHVLNYLHTTFGQTDEEIAEARRIRLEEVKRSGIFNHPKGDGGAALDDTFKT